MNHAICFATRSSRPGVAPIEFVMGLPFLMLLFGFTFALGFVILGQADTAITARHEAWKLRDRSSTWSNDYLSVFETVKPDSGRVDQVKTNDVKVYDWLGGTIQNKSHVVVLSGTWDSDQVVEFNRQEPHLSVYDRMVGGSGVVGEGISAVFRPLLSVQLENEDDIRDANDEVKEQKEEVERQLKEMQDKIEDIRMERDALIAERDALQDDYDDKEEDRDDLKDDQQRLRDEANQLPLNSPERAQKLQQAADLDTPIAALEVEMGDLQDQIDAKNVEIRAKQKELDDAEDALRQAQDEIDKNLP